MRRFSEAVATERFWEMLDAVEAGESLLIERNGRPVALIEPLPPAGGALTPAPPVDGKPI